ncbi:pesticidal protein Cry7Aa [uncultured Winogradskyella sp.]|uniref:glycoside hydrolase family 130 protein n=1 Tax=uncultured Winogradskyella sp. TaxID=395353 RepID=UPI0026352086|nr:pesticidal protein Cry7Aa [uncultured Winogradskyella sp.]
MTLVTKHGVILKKTNNSFENLGVFNPAVMQEGNTVHLLYRAVRNGNFSTIGYSKLEGPLKVVKRLIEPVFFSETPEEFQGVEDPRITKIDDTYYLSYAAYDGINVFGAYATSKDLKTFERQGIITPKFTFEEYSELIKNNYEKISIHHTLFYDLYCRYKLERLMKGKIYVWDKNIIFFPKKINGKFAVFHRLFPSIQILYFNDPSELTVAFWETYISNLRQHIVLQPKYKHESSHIGGGCPPIETDLGWLVIYHSVENHTKHLIYHASAVLLDLNDPRKVLGRLNKPLFSPTESYEKVGYVNNVVFPTGTALFDDELYIYYGAADSCVAVASVNINTLLDELKNQ